MDAWLIVVIAICAAALIAFIVQRVVRAHQQKVAAGREDLVGMTAEVETDLNPKGIVLVEGERWAPGGAANVAAAVVALGAGCELVGVVGDDAAGARLMAALGELHEFDQEYEMARHYYRGAVDLLDRQFHGQVASDLDAPALIETLKGTRQGLEAAQLRAQWGMSRLRLMLQAALSYERASDNEHAQVVYRNARSLATALLRALLDEPKGIAEHVAAMLGQGKKEVTIRHRDIERG